MARHRRIRIERAGQGAFPLADLHERPPPPVPWLRIILAGLLAVGVLAGAAIGVIRALIDTDALRAEAEAALRQATGREVTIGSPLIIDSIAKAIVAVENVVIPTREGFAGPPLARIGRLEAELSRSSLLSGKPVIKRLVIADPEIHLEIDAEGRPNWRNPSAEAPAAPRPGAGHAMPHSIHLKDGRLTFADARAGRPATSLALRRVTLAEAEGGGLLQLSADLGYATQRISASGQVGPLSRLLDTAATTAWPLRVALESQGAKLTVAGGIQRPLELGGYAVKVDAWVADTTTLGGLVPYRLPIMRTVSLTARLADTGGSMPDIAGARLQMGASDLSAWVPGLKIDTADITMPGLEQGTRAEVLGALNGVPVRLQAALGGLAAFLPEKVEDPAYFPIEAEAEAGATKVTVRGGIAAVGQRRGLDLAVSARVADLELLSPLVGQRLPRLNNLAIDGRLADADGGFAERIALRGISVIAPLGDIGGDFVLRIAERWGLSGTVRSTKLNADELAAVLSTAFGPFDLAERPDPFRLRAQNDGRVIPNRRLAFDQLRLADADLTLALGELLAGGATWRNVAGRVRLEAGQLGVGPLLADLPNGQASLRLSIDAADPRMPVALRAAIPGIPIQPLLAGSTRRDNLFGQLEIDADLTAQGETPRALADSVTGRLGLAIVEGDIDSRLLTEPLAGVMGAAKVPLNLATQMGSLARLRCFAARVDAERGKVRIGGAVLESGRVLIQAGGGVDLPAEQLLLRVRSTIRIPNQGVSVPSRLEGGFQALKFEIEPQDQAQAAAAVRADAPDACVPVLEQARAGRAGPMPGDPNARPSLVAPPQRPRR